MIKSNKMASPFETTVFSISRREGSRSFGFTLRGIESRFVVEKVLESMLL